jgi:hypothetical protein
MLNVTSHQKPGMQDGRKRRTPTVFVLWITDPDFMRKLSSPILIKYLFEITEENRSIRCMGVNSDFPVIIFK